MNFVSDDLFYVLLIACQLLLHKLAGVVEVLTNEISVHDSLLTTCGLFIKISDVGKMIILFLPFKINHERDP